MLQDGHHHTVLIKSIENVWEILNWQKIQSTEKKLSLQIAQTIEKNIVFVQQYLLLGLP